MEYMQAIQACKDTGLAAGILGLCVWMVRFVVMRLSVTVDKLSDKIDAMGKDSGTFMAMVKKEHEQQNDHHEKLMGEHDEMIKTLGRINGYRDEG